MVMPLPPLNVAGGTAGPSEAKGQNSFSFNTGAFGAEPATNKLIGLILPISALAAAGFIIWHLLKSKT